MKQVIVFLLIILSINCNAQSLSPERVKKIKACTVRVTIIGDNSIGTGFFINQQGWLITCWHVVAPAIIRNNLNQAVGLKDIYVVYFDGTREQFGIPDYFLQQGNLDAVAFDFCLLIPKTPKSTYPFLKIGDFDKSQEGEGIYTCGYPIGIQQQFVSSGFISTKYTDTSHLISNGKNIALPRTQALLDITLNRGNSGGAIVRMGKNIDDDEVIGIADFIITPAGGQMENLSKYLEQVNKHGSIDLMGVNTNEVFKYFSDTFNKLSIGVSGCVSLNHFLQAAGMK